MGPFEPKSNHFDQTLLACSFSGGSLPTEEDKEFASYFNDPRFFGYFCDREFRRDMSKLFTDFDTNFSGRISFNEVHQAFKCRSGNDGIYDEPSGSGDDVGYCGALDALGLQNKGTGESNFRINIC